MRIIRGVAGSALHPDLIQCGSETYTGPKAGEMKGPRQLPRRNKGIISTSFIPSIPVEVWFEAWPCHRWRLVQQGDDFLFEFCSGRTSCIEKDADPYRRFVVKSFSGPEYVQSILEIETPEQLLELINTCSAIQNLGESPSDAGRGFFSPFQWSRFLEAQSKLNHAMLDPVPKLVLNDEFSRAFTLEELRITAEKRGEVYFGVVTLKPTLQSCYRVVAVARLLGKLKYDRCVRCRRLFQVTSGHRRKFCSDRGCAHAAAQQNFRDRMRKQLDNR